MSKIRAVYLGCISAIYLVAFTSLYVQIPGLYGNNGVLPARLMIKRGTRSFWKILWSEQPTLLRFYPILAVNTEAMMDVLSLIGIAVSLLSLIFTSLRCAPIYLILWAMYFSLFQVGETFLWFQWDILLLEAGVLTVIAAPILPTRKLNSNMCHHEGITLWLVKWLLFRLMFASGVVKLQSHCPTWWGLTALNYHFESQCIPTPFSYYIHQLPPWLLKLGVVQTYVTQIAFSFLFFSPLRSLRVFSFYALVLHQVFILLSGNYNFFNLISIVLALPLLAENPWSKATKKRWFLSSRVVDYVVRAGIFIYLTYYVINLFSLKLQDGIILSDIAFTQREFEQWVHRVIPLTIWMGFISLGIEIFTSVISCIVKSRRKVFKMLHLSQCVLYAIIALFMFAISLVPHTVVDRETLRTLPADIRTAHGSVGFLHLTSSYGLFRRMTGVGGRPEVIIEGSQDGSTWHEYEFPYKPGDLSRSPPFVAPHQPRLDWQMWFAALGSYHHNQWFLNLVYRLLMNQREVVDLLTMNPFNGTSPPLLIRAQLYHYHFTHWQDGTADWWWREKKSTYLPAVSARDAGFMEYVKSSRITEKGTLPRPSILLAYLKSMRLILTQFDPFWLISTLVLAGGALNQSLDKVRRAPRR